MAGISVTLEGDNIQLAFQKGDQATAVVMDPQAARSLVKAVGQLLTAIGESAGTGESEGEDDAMGEMVDVTSQTIDMAWTSTGSRSSHSRRVSCRRSCCVSRTTKQGILRKA